MQTQQNIVDTEEAQDTKLYFFYFRDFSMREFKGTVIGTSKDEATFKLASHYRITKAILSDWLEVLDEVTTPQQLLEYSTGEKGIFQLH